MSPDQRPLAFIVGAQRSGTTWVQRLLGAHPLIAAGQESHLFSSYLAPIWQRWFDERIFRAGGNRTIGLACYLTQDELIAAMREFARIVFAKLENAKPEARLILEKTPDHSLHMPLIEMLFPQSTIIHVLRDGRDVVASLCSAHRQGWGRGWATAKVADAARRWVDWVREICHQSNFFKHVHLVRFEDLLENGPATLHAMYEFLQLPLPLTEVETIYHQFSFAACAAGTAPESLVLAGEITNQPIREPDGFFRQGRSGTWRDDLAPQEQAVVEEIAGKLLRELGYLSIPELAAA